MYSNPLVSAICVSRRLNNLAESLVIFRHQTYPTREIVVVSENRFKQAITSLLQSSDERLVVGEGSLGHLRNLGISRATPEVRPSPLERGNAREKKICTRRPVLCEGPPRPYRQPTSRSTVNGGPPLCARVASSSPRRSRSPPCSESDGVAGKGGGVKCEV